MSLHTFVMELPNEILPMGCLVLSHYRPEALFMGISWDPLRSSVIYVDVRSTPHMLHCVQMCKGSPLTGKTSDESVCVCMIGFSQRNGMQSCLNGHLQDPCSPQRRIQEQGLCRPLHELLMCHALMSLLATYLRT